MVWLVFVVVGVPEYILDKIRYLKEKANSGCITVVQING